MKLISLKKPKRPKRKLRPETAIDEPMYPWGLELTLENDSVKKLGIDIQNNMAGDSVNIVAKAKITSISRRQNTEPGNKTRQNDSISLQITDMAYGVPLKT